MANPNPLEHLFAQIADLLAMAQENEQKVLSGGKLDDNLEEDIAAVEQQIALFRKITDEALKRSGLDEETVQNTIDNPSLELGAKQQKILLQARELKGELERFEREYARKSQLVKLQKKKAKSSGKKRIKKFKRLGGQGWMPM